MHYITSEQQQKNHDSTGNKNGHDDQERVVVNHFMLWEPIKVQQTLTIQLLQQQKSYQNFIFHKFIGVVVVTLALSLILFDFGFRLGHNRAPISMCSCSAQIIYHSDVRNNSFFFSCGLQNKYFTTTNEQNESKQHLAAHSIAPIIMCTQKEQKAKQKLTFAYWKS